MLAEGHPRAIDRYDVVQDKWSTDGEYPGGNYHNPQIVADGNRVYVIGESVKSPAPLEAWVGTAGSDPNGP